MAVEWASDDGGARRGIQRSVREDGWREAVAVGWLEIERRWRRRKSRDKSKTKVVPELFKVEKILIRFKQIINNQLGGLIILITSTKNFP